LADKDDDMTTLQASLNLRQSELLAKLSGMLPTHPGRPGIEKELREIGEVLEDKRTKITQSYSSILLAQRQAELAAAIQSEHQLQKEVDLQAHEASWYAGNYQRGLNLGYAMSRSRKRLEAIEDRIDSIAQEREAPCFVHIFSPARPALEPTNGGRKVFVLGTVVAAALFALLIPVVIDMSDPHILSAEEAEKLLGFPSIGFIYDSNLVEPAKSNGRFRRLAAAIEREVDRNASRSFLFVSINPHFELNGLLLQVAGELEALGRNVKVILSPLLTELPLINTLSSLDAARSPSLSEYEPHRSESLRDEVASVRDGIVIVGTAPLTEDAEAELLSSSCDVVILTVQAGITTRAELRASALLLEKIQPRAVSALVTSCAPNSPTPFVWPKLALFASRFWAKNARTL
jgi:hypothetical protein